MDNISDRLNNIYKDMRHIIISLESNRVKGAIARIEYISSQIKSVVDNLATYIVEPIQPKPNNTDTKISLEKQLKEANWAIRELKKKLEKYSLAGRNTDADTISCEELLNHIDHLKIKIKKECSNPEQISFYNLAVRDIETEIRIKRFANNHR